MQNSVAYSTKAAEGADNEFLTYNELPGLLRCSKRTVADLVARGEIPYVKLSRRRVIFHRKTIMQWLLSRQYGVRKEPIV